MDDLQRLRSIPWWRWVWWHFRWNWDEQCSAWSVLLTGDLRSGQMGGNQETNEIWAEAWTIQSRWRERVRLFALYSEFILIGLAVTLPPLLASTVSEIESVAVSAPCILLAALFDSVKSKNRRWQARERYD